MATFNLRRLTKPEVLRSVDRSHLIALLQRFRTHLTANNLTLPPVNSRTELDYSQLIRILADAEGLAGAEQALIDALYFIDAFSAPEHLDRMLECAADHEITLADTDEQSPADVAVQIWLANPELLQELHAENNLSRPRSFTYFMPSASPREVPLPTRAALSRLEHSLDERFEKKKRGRTAKVFMYPRQDGAIWFLIRHGEPFRREGSIRNGESASIAFRPERYDVVVYEQTTGELRAHAGAPREYDLYREQFGVLLHGDGAFFSAGEKYSLDPLRTDGSSSLRCDDIEGLDNITLVEIEYRWPGTPPETEIRKCDDIFAALQRRNTEIPARPRIARAVFEVRFTQASTKRRVTIKVPRNGQFKVDEDSIVIERWLAARGFTRSAGDDQNARSALAGTRRTR